MRLALLASLGLSLATLLSTATADAQTTAALMPDVPRPAGFTEGQVEALRRAARQALREASHRVLARREVAARLSTGMRCGPPEPCLEPAHAALGVDLVVRLAISGSPGSARVSVQITDGSTRVNHSIGGTADGLATQVHDTVLRAARRIQMGRR
ncbi:MAG: hypothetical protein AB8I08_34180 [Sandaracinaceae bacterium]